jgi:predicted anti-sigma-YlaC factor YlaD
MYPKTQLCERARAWASLQTDGELSELESALLEAHLGRCEACRTFALEAAEVAAALRTAPLEQPTPFVLVPRNARRASLRALQVAAAVVVVVSAGIVAAVSGSSGSTTAAKPVAMVAGADSPDRLRELRRPGLVAKPAAFVPRNRQLPGEPV